MSETVNCVHCGASLQVDSETVTVAQEYADGSVVCKDCEGRAELPANVPECDRDDCNEPGPFVIETASGDIRRCRNCIVEDLTEFEWFDFYAPGRGDREPKS